MHFGETCLGSFTGNFKEMMSDNFLKIFLSFEIASADLYFCYFAAILIFSFCKSVAFNIF